MRDALREAAVEEFLPTFHETVRWSDRNTVTERALFPGYVFARFDPAARGEVLAIRGVVQILSLDLKPVPIPDDVITDLQRVVLSRKTLVCHPYVVGGSVCVSRGPFAGVTGIISRVKDATLLSIPIEILGRCVQVTIDAKDVVAA